MIQPSPTTELTICTVSFGHRPLVEANIQLVRELNPEVSVRWIIVENGTEGMNSRFEFGEFPDGVVLSGDANTFQGIASASYHHASGLNKAVQEATTRFVLVLDPDFYITRNMWVSEVLTYMKSNSIGFFGVPYNPKRYMKYRYFPCIHAMFIDLERVKKQELDFSPRYDQTRLLVGRKKSMEQGVRSAGLPKGFTHLKKWAKVWIKRGGIIGSSRDTGYGVYEKFSCADETEYQCVQPVFKYMESDINPKYVASVFNRLVEKFLPEKWCYIPKRKDYFTKRGFKESGYPDVLGRGWDEFMWKGTPFGFHLQGARKDGTTIDHTSRLSELQIIFNMCKNMSI